MWGGGPYNWKEKVFLFLLFLPMIIGDFFTHHLPRLFRRRK